MVVEMLKKSKKNLNSLKPNIYLILVSRQNMVSMVYLENTRLESGIDRLCFLLVRIFKSFQSPICLKVLTVLFAVCWLLVFGCLLVYLPRFRFLCPSLRVFLSSSHCHPLEDRNYY